MRTNNMPDDNLEVDFCEVVDALQAKVRERRDAHKEDLKSLIQKAHKAIDAAAAYAEENGLAFYFREEAFVSSKIDLELSKVLDKHDLHDEKYDLSEVYYSVFGTSILDDCGDVVSGWWAPSNC